MTHRPTRAAGLALSTAFALVAPAAAHEGHDHGAPVAVPVPAATPRFVAATELFELVGALEGRRLRLWLDRTDSNAPVLGATIDLDLGGRTLTARPDGEVYVAELDAAPGPGVIPVAATVVAGAEADVLAAELRIDAADPTGGRPPAQARPAGTLVDGDTLRLVSIGAAAAGVAGLLGWLAGRRRRTLVGE
jgi:hypothetical protein